MLHSLLKKSGIGLLLVLAVMTSCQKSSDTKKTETAKLTDTDKTIVDSVCSEAVLKLSADFQDSQIKSTDIFEQLSIKAGDVNLQQQYKRSAQKQVESCKALSAQLKTENVASCLKSADLTLIDNTITKPKIDGACKSTINFYNRILRQYGGEAVNSVSKHLTLKFSEAAKILIHSKGTGEFNYLANGVVKTGRETLKQDVLDKNVSCLFNASAESSKKESEFNVLSEMSEPTIDSDISFTGLRFALILEDSNHLMMSLTCLNTSFELEKNSKENLQKILGQLIVVEEKSSAPNVLQDSAHLNSDVAPSVPPIQTANEPKPTAPDTQKKATDIVDDLVTKAKATIHDVVKDTLAEIKTTTDQTRSETIVDVKKATQELTTEALNQAAAVAQKLSEDTIKNATLAAEKISDQIIEKGAVAAQVVSEKAIEKAAASALVVSKAVLAEAEKTADRVVKNSVQTIETAVISTAAKPLEYVQGKVTDAIEATVETTKDVYNYFKNKIVGAGKAVSAATESPYEKLKKKSTEDKK